MLTEKDPYPTPHPPHLIWYYPRVLKVYFWIDLEFNMLSDYELFFKETSIIYRDIACFLLAL